MHFISHLCFLFSQFYFSGFIWPVLSLPSKPASVHHLSARCPDILSPANCKWLAMPRKKCWWLFACQRHAVIKKLNAVKKGVAKASGWRMRDDEAEARL